MNMVPVKSSAISAIGYDEPTQTMRILFKAGGMYDHRRVTPKQHQALMAAKSVGSHYTKNHSGGGIKVKK